MLSKLLVSPVVFLILLAGCSGGNFDVVESPDSSSADETSVDSSPVPEDSSTPTETGAPEDSSTPADSGTIEADSMAADSDSGVDSSAGDGTIDSTVTDSAVDTGAVLDSATTDTRPLDTCVVNACGGCSVLSGTVGASCAGGCGGGKLSCKGTDALECTGMKAPNACGGCDPLDHVLGTTCGKCSTGSYVCDTTDSSKNKTKCNDPVTTPAPGTACTGSDAGKCGTAKYQCTTVGTTTITKCVDPVSSPFAVGDPCGGKCGSATYQCTTDKTSITCNDPVPATSPLASMKCGICESSITKCNSTKTDVVCEIPDDRSSALAPNNVVTASSWGTNQLNRYTALAVPFTATANGTRVDTVTVKLSRRPYYCIDWEDGSGGCGVEDPNCVCDCWNPCTIKPTGVDVLKLELVTGTPSTPGSVLDTATVTPTSVPTYPTSPPYTIPSTTTTFTFTDTSIRLPVGTKFFLRLIAQGAGYHYQLWGAPPTTSSPVDVLFSKNGGAWSTNGVDPYLVVNRKACF